MLLLLLFYLLREILRRDHSYETSLIVLSHGTIFLWDFYEWDCKTLWLRSRWITLANGAFSLTWPASMQIYWEKRKVYVRRVQHPRDWFVFEHQPDVMWKGSIIGVKEFLWRLFKPETSPKTPYLDRRRASAARLHSFSLSLYISDIFLYKTFISVFERVNWIEARWR